MDYDRLDFSKRYIEVPTIEHPNICGTKKELLDYLNTIINGRELIISEDVTLEKQIRAISRTCPPDGIIALMFKNDNDLILETQRVFVQSKKRKKK